MDSKIQTSVESSKGPPLAFSLTPSLAPYFFPYPSLSLPAPHILKRPMSLQSYWDLQHLNNLLVWWYPIWKALIGLAWEGAIITGKTWLTWLCLGPAWVRISLIIWKNLEWEKSSQHSRAELLCRKECVTDQRSSNSSLTSYAYDTYSFSKPTLKNVSSVQNSGLWPVYHLFNKYFWVLKIQI